MAGYVIEFAAENPHACVMRQYIRDLLTEQGCEVEMHDDGEVFFFFFFFLLLLYVVAPVS